MAVAFVYTFEVVDACFTAHKYTHTTCNINVHCKPVTLFHNIMVVYICLVRALMASLTRCLLLHAPVDFNPLYY